jgi:Ala-tRNA(Pro) deacylase
MSLAVKLQNYLDENKVRYHVLKHHAAYTAREIAEALHVPGKELAKVVMVKADDRFIMVVLPANNMIHFRALAQAVGVREARLAEEWEFERLFPDCEVGAMPPFGNLYHLPVYVEESLAEDEEIVFEAGTHREAIKMAYRDYESLVQPKLVQLGRVAA